MESTKELGKKYFSIITFLSIISNLINIGAALFVPIFKVTLLGETFSETIFDYLLKFFEMIKTKNTDIEVLISKHYVITCTLCLTIFIVGIACFANDIHFYLKKKYAKAALNAGHCWLTFICSCICYIHSAYLIMNEMECSLMEFLKGETFVTTSLHWIVIIQAAIVALNIYLKKNLKKEIKKSAEEAAQELVNKYQYEHKNNFNNSSYDIPKENTDGNTYRVIINIQNDGYNKLQLLKTIRETTYCSLTDAKSLLENLPTVIKDNISLAEALSLKQKFDECGILVIIEKI